MNLPEFENISTQLAVETYDSSQPIFAGILKEVRELPRKKPEATMSAGKVKLINRVLNDLLNILKHENTAKYLDVLDDESLPQMSDAVLMMVQYETALRAFKARYTEFVRGKPCWITHESLAKWRAEERC